MRQKIKSFSKEDEQIENLEQQNKRYREALENIMKVREKHKWNMYGIAYGIAENAILESESNE